MESMLLYKPNVVKVIQLADIVLTDYRRNTLAKYQCTNEQQKEFIRELEKIGGLHTTRDLFLDWVRYTALGISLGGFDTQKEEHIEELNGIVKKYKESELEQFNSLAEIVAKHLKNNTDQDYLGDIYVELGLSNGNRGQIFTPYYISKLMAKLIYSPDTGAKGYTTASDPCIGSGTLMIAYANCAAENGLSIQDDLLIVGQDIDRTLAMISYIQLSIIGAAGYVSVGNSLLSPVCGTDLFPPYDKEVFITPAFCTGIWELRRLIWLASIQESNDDESDQQE